MLVVEDRVNNLDVWLSAQQTKHNDLEANHAFQIAALKGQLQQVGERMRELSGEPMVAAAITSVKARRAMRPETCDLTQPPLTPAQLAMVPSSPGSAVTGASQNHDGDVATADDDVQYSLAAGDTPIAPKHAFEDALGNLQDLSFSTHGTH